MLEKCVVACCVDTCESSCPDCNDEGLNYLQITQAVATLSKVEGLKKPASIEYTTQDILSERAPFRIPRP